GRQVGEGPPQRAHQEEPEASDRGREHQRADVHDREGTRAHRRADGHRRRRRAASELRVQREEAFRRRHRVRERLRAGEPGAARLTYAYSALWKMIPSVVRSPVWTVLTPCRMATRFGPRLPGTGRVP